MTTGAAVRRQLVWQQFVPIAFGVACLIAVIALLEVLIRAGIVNRFIVPTPLDIIGSFGRIIREEHVGERFLLTCYEALGASIGCGCFDSPPKPGLQRWRPRRSF
jgi:NitT/TauT family transport system permease protein